MQVDEQEGEHSRQRQQREDPEERVSHTSRSLKVAGEQSEGRHVCEADGESRIRVGQVDRAGRQKGE